MTISGERNWAWTRGATQGIAALVIAAALWIPASFASACNACGEFQGIQALSRGAVAFSPMWLLFLAVVALRVRSFLVLLLLASAAMAAVTAILGTDLRKILEPLGLASATGFVLYSVPFLITAIAAALGLRR
jgi:hypothetical protein